MNTKTIKLTEPDDKPILVLFHATWCPYSKNIYSAWREAQLLLKDQIYTIDMESKDSRLSKHKITSFPTIRFYPCGLKEFNNFIEFKGDRTAERIHHFAMTGGKF